MIAAVIFDMDGILIDSEPLWHESEVEVFTRVGIPFRKEDCLETQGVRIDEVVDFWFERRPWRGSSRKDVAEGIVTGLIARIRERGELMPGVISALDFVAGCGVRIALASSSSYAIIDTVLDRFELRGRFEVIYSAQEEEYGKPHPAVYITTAKKLNVRPDDCLAIEDSINGVISAKAAKMKCIAVPEPTARNDRRYGVADVVMARLDHIDQALWRRLNGESRAYPKGNPS